MKRVVDIVVSTVALALISPLMLIAMALIWAVDFHSPFYAARRVRRRGEVFHMLKLRSMVVNADQLGGTATALDDRRVTRIGRFVRHWKLDEFPQFWNVLRGEMSVVGPRPRVQQDADAFTEEEYQILDTPPGVTDFASIVFTDEGEILKGSSNPDQEYNQVIRPWRNRLALFYVRNRSVATDLKLIWLTAVSIVSRPAAVRGVVALLRKLNADEQLIIVASRTRPLHEFAVTGASRNEAGLTSLPVPSRPPLDPRGGLGHSRTPVSVNRAASEV